MRIGSDDAAKYALGLGNLVINRVNSPSHLGKSLVVRERHLPSVFESNMMQLELAPSVDARFVQRLLTSTDGKRRLVKNAKWAVNQASINQSDVMRTPVPLPPHVEQIRSLAEIELRFSLTGEMLHLVELNMDRCTRLRQSTLKWAFEGKLAEQDPVDEPASLLLKRLREERAVGEGRRRNRRGART